MTQKEFFEWLIESKSYAEPFCPFNHIEMSGGYCNVAYSQECWNCQFRIGRPRKDAIDERFGFANENRHGSY